MSLVVWRPPPAEIACFMERRRVVELASGAVSLEQNFAGSGIAGAVWLAGMVLAAYVEWRGGWAGRIGLELGAGGAGLGTIALLRSGAGRVATTDGDDGVLELLGRNVGANVVRGDNWAVRRLVWGSKEDGRAALEALGGRRPQVVVAADCVYDGTRHAWTHLLDTCALVAPGGVVILAYVRRYQHDEDTFLEMARSRSWRVARVSKSKLLRALPASLRSAAASTVVLELDRHQDNSETAPASLHRHE